MFGSYAVATKTQQQIYQENERQRERQIDQEALPYIEKANTIRDESDNGLREKAAHIMTAANIFKSGGFQIKAFTRYLEAQKILSRVNSKDTDVLWAQINCFDGILIYHVASYKMDPISSIYCQINTNNHIIELLSKLESMKNKEPSEIYEKLANHHLEMALLYTVSEESLSQKIKPNKQASISHTIEAVKYDFHEIATPELLKNLSKALHYSMANAFEELREVGDKRFLEIKSELQEVKSQLDKINTNSFNSKASWHRLSELFATYNIANNENTQVSNLSQPLQPTSDNTPSIAPIYQH